MCEMLFVKKIFVFGPHLSILRAKPGSELVDHFGQSSKGHMEYLGLNLVQLLAKHPYNCTSFLVPIVKNYL